MIDETRQRATRHDARSSRPTPSGDGHGVPALPPARPARKRIACVLAALAVVASVVAAVGPANDVYAVHSWPGATTPERNSETTVYSKPLLLIRRTPKSVAATVACRTPLQLRRAGRNTLVLATAKFPGRAGGLAIRRSGAELAISVGGRLLDRVRATSSQDSGCAVDVHLVGQEWTVRGGSDSVVRTGRLERMPVVNGIFAALEPGSPRPPTIEIETIAYAADPTARQTVAWITAILLAAIALCLLIPTGTRREVRHAKVSDSARRLVKQAGAPDVVVGLLLVGWWILSPTFWDDGWIATSQRVYDDAGGFSSYYNLLGVNHPFGFWLDWLQHWLAQSTTSLLLLRLPALACLGLIWVLCRWILSRVLGPSGTCDADLWTLALAFGLCALAWGMTLRPEPQLALLITGVLACSLLFAQREREAVLITAMLLTVLAISAHPIGILAVAPMLAIARPLGRWIRREAIVACTIALAGAAVLISLASVGADLQVRRGDARTVQQITETRDAWFDELARYAYTLDPQYGTPLRRGSVRANAARRLGVRVKASPGRATRH